MTMKSHLLLLAGAAALSLGAASMAQTPQVTSNSSGPTLRELPEIPFTSKIVITDEKMPKNVFIGEPAGVAVSRKGHIYLYTRTGEAGDIATRRSAQLFEFDKDGNFIKEIGGPNNYVMGWAHSVRVDSDDNVWIADAGTHMISKWSPDGRLLLALGRRPESTNVFGAAPAPGAYPRLGLLRDEIGSFAEPTDIAFDSKGNVYVSDGYQNSYVHKFDKYGEFVTRWGSRGSGPGQFLTPHAIAVSADDKVYVADRGNNRIQVFDSEGKFLKEIRIDTRHPDGYVPKVFGYMKDKDGRYLSFWPVSVCISGGANPVLWSTDADLVVKMTLDGKVLGRFGTEGRRPGTFASLHNIACTDDPNTVYVVENVNMRVTRIMTP